MNPISETELKNYITKLENITIQIADNLCADKTINREVKQALSGIDLSDVESYLKSNLKHSYKLLNTTHSKFALLALYSICKNKYDKQYINSILRSLAVIYYNVLLNKYVKYCNDVIMLKALQSVKSTNIFKKYGIENGLYVIADSVAKKIKENSSCEILFYIKKIYELRHRIAQSLKSITTLYYKLYNIERKLGPTSINYDRIVDDIVQKILFYGYVKIPPKCTRIYNIYNNLVKIDEDLLTNSIHEIIHTLGTHPSHQKILKNLHRLKHTRQVLKELGVELNVKSLYCYVSTIYYTMNS